MKHLVAAVALVASVWLLVAGVRAADPLAPGRPVERAPEPSKRLQVTSGLMNRDARHRGVPFSIEFEGVAVAADAVGVPVTELPIRITPAWAVTAAWSDQSTIVFTPQEPCRSSTRYTVALTGDLAARAGAWEDWFVCDELRVKGVSGLEPQMMPRDARLSLAFDKPVRAADVVAGCHYARGDVRVPSTTADPALVATTIPIAPATSLDTDTVYTLHCDALGMEGAHPTSSVFRRRFRTERPFRVALVRPEGTGLDPERSTVVVRFSAPIDPNRLPAAVRLEPAPLASSKPTVNTGKSACENTWASEEDCGRPSVTFTPVLAPSTSYVLRIDPTLTDIAGRPLEGPTEFRFTTGARRFFGALALETGGPRVVEAGPGGRYPIWTQNLSSLQVDCAAVPLERLQPVLAVPWYDNPWPVEEYWEGEGEGEEEADEDDSDGATDEKPREPHRLAWHRWADEPTGENLFDWAGLGLRHRASRVKTPGPRARWNLQSVPIGRVCGGRNPLGLFLSEVSSTAAPDGRDPEQPERWRFFANVTDLGVLVKHGDSTGLAWVTRLSDGQPVGGARVSLVSQKGEVALAGTTAADGLVRFAWPASVELVVAEQGGDMAVLPSGWTDGIGTWAVRSHFDLPWASNATLRGYLLSDRGIYRPGETAHLKGWVREVTPDRGTVVPVGLTATVRVEDARGAKVLDQAVPLSSFGGFSLDFVIPPDASLGDYRLLAEVGPQVFSDTFVVQEFRTASFALTAQADATSAGIGETVGVGLEARYLFGAPVAAATVEWIVSRRARSVAFATRPDHTFARYDEGRAWGDSDLTFVTEESGATDADGRLRFDVRAEDGDRPQDYLVLVGVSDETGETISKRLAVAFYPRDRYLGLKPSGWFFERGAPIDVSVVAVALDGQPVATSARLDLVDRDWVCTRPAAGTSGSASCRYVETVVSSETLDIPASGEVTARVQAATGGSYLLRVTGQDGAGRPLEATDWLWVAGGTDAPRDDSPLVKLVPSKRLFAVGDTARIVPERGTGKAPSLVTIERGELLDAFVTDLDPAEGFEIPIKQSYAPNAFATLTRTYGRRGTTEAERPRLELGATELKLDTSDRRLRVELRTERDRYEPGDEVVGTVRVSAGDAPVVAEVALSVADEGVLQLVAFRTPDAFRTFYASFGLDVTNLSNWFSLVTVQDPDGLVPTHPTPEEMGGDAKAAQQVRSRFVASAYWDPGLVTGANGEATFRFVAPDNLTTFRIMATAADAGDRFGSGERPLLVTKPVIAQPLLPRFLSEGDELQVGLDVRNLTAEAGKAHVTAKAEGLDLDDDEADVTLAAGASSIVRFAAEVAKGARQATVTFAATLATGRDAVAITLPVRRPMTIDRALLAAGLVDGAAELSVDWPSGADLEESRLEVTVDQGGLAELGPALRDLVEYPYGCLEQTLSVFVPLVKVKDLAQSLALPELAGGRLDEYVAVGVRKVQKHQAPDGHFRLWPGSEPEPHLTAYALYGLLEAQRAGVAVDAAVIQRGVAALREWANGEGRSLAAGEGATMAMSAQVLADLGAPDPGLAARLFEKRGTLPVYGRAFLLGAMAAGGARSEDVATLRGELEGLLERTGTVAFAREEPGLERFWSSDVRSTAVVLSALVRTRCGAAGSEAACLGDPIVSGLVEGLRASRSPGGAWQTTQENQYALVALADYARLLSRATRRVTVTLEDRPLGAATLAGAEVLAIGAPLATLEEGALRIETDGPARYAVRLVTARPDPGDEPRASGMTVTRRYVRAGTLEPAVELRVGDLVEVLLEVETGVPLDYVALVDPLPAGLEPINPELATSQGMESGDDSGGYDYDDELAARWVHLELRDDRVLAFADHVGVEPLTLTYMARALTPGTFTAAPAHAEAMYAPDVYGRTGATRLEIRP